MVRATSFWSPEKSRRPSTSQAVVSAQADQRFAAAVAVPFGGAPMIPHPTTWSTMVSTALAAYGLFLTTSRAAFRVGPSAVALAAFPSVPGRFHPDVRRPPAAAS